MTPTDSHREAAAPAATAAPAEPWGGRDGVNLPTRLLAYLSTAVLWYLAYLLYPILTRDILTGGGEYLRESLPVAPLGLLFLVIVLLYQILFDLAIRRWQSMSLTVFAGIVAPMFGAMLFLGLMLVLGAHDDLGRLQHEVQRQPLAIASTVLLVPIFFLCVSAPVTLPLSVFTVWLVRHLAPMPECPSENFDLY